MKTKNWDKKFSEKFFIKNSELSVETFLKVQDFIQNLLDKQRSEIIDIFRKAIIDYGGTIDLVDLERDILEQLKQFK